MNFRCRGWQIPWVHDHPPWKEVNPDQISAIERLKPPSNPKKVQVLTGMLVVLNRLVSKSVDQCCPFYQLPKKWRGFQWIEKCEKAFQDLQKYLVSAPILSAPEAGEDLFMYLLVSEHAVSTVLLRDKESKSQSITLVRPWLIRRQGWIAKWGTRLGSFDIWYKPRSSVKSQVLIDFVAEFTPQKESGIVCNVDAWPWRVFMDGESNAIGVGAGIFIVTLEGIRVEHSFTLGFKVSNNKAKYEALLAGVRAALSLGATDLEVYSDSRLVVS
ncbi:uncharacterized protein LOC142612341 [Castanea sativa]|uniref:uncharacterized protein LOC142612341 n=1 Tax=Castanea sativa TaxID=21020 RepID=UPI003F64AA9D